jgi:hypothetical protein
VYIQATDVCRNWFAVNPVGEIIGWYASVRYL